MPAPEVVWRCPSLTFAVALCRRKQLSGDCRAAMFDEETLMGESIDFQFPMKTACARVLSFSQSSTPQHPLQGCLCRCTVCHSPPVLFRTSFVLHAQRSSTSGRHWSCVGNQVFFWTCCERPGRLTRAGVGQVAGDRWRGDLPHNHTRSATRYFDGTFRQHCEGILHNFCRSCRGGARTSRTTTRRSCPQEKVLCGYATELWHVDVPQELKQWCADVPHDHARAIRCLQDNQDKPGFGQTCRTEMVAHEQHAATDYRCTSVAFHHQQS